MTDDKVRLQVQLQNEQGEPIKEVDPVVSRRDWLDLVDALPEAFESRAQIAAFFEGGRKPLVVVPWSERFGVRDAAASLRYAEGMGVLADMEFPDS